MSNNDLIRRSDALALMRHDPFLIGLREEWAGMAPDEDGDWVSFHALTTLPAADPLADPRVQALVEALEWYREQARLARLIHSEGDAGRHALQADGGKRAAAAIAAFKGDEA
jgi:hypothetical protein